MISYWITLCVMIIGVFMPVFCIFYPAIKSYKEKGIIVLRDKKCSTLGFVFIALFSIGIMIVCGYYSYKYCLDVPQALSKEYSTQTGIVNNLRKRNAKNTKTLFNINETEFMIPTYISEIDEGDKYKVYYLKNSKHVCYIEEIKDAE